MHMLDLTVQATWRTWISRYDEYEFAGVNCCVLVQEQATLIAILTRLKDYKFQHISCDVNKQRGWIQYYVDIDLALKALKAYVIHSSPNNT